MPDEMRVYPQHDAMWMQAKEACPSRQPYTDSELMDLRLRYSTASFAGKAQVNYEEAVVIWTLLDMLESARGWPKQ